MKTEKFACPHCSAVIEAPIEYAGYERECASCNGPYIVPEFEASTSGDDGAFRDEKRIPGSNSPCESGLGSELKRLSQLHSDGDVYLRDISGNSYTPLQLLETLPSESLAAGFAIEGSAEGDWISRSKKTILGGEKLEKWFSIHGDSGRRGWASSGVCDESYKIHFMEFDATEDRFVSLCKRDFAANDYHTAFTNISESDSRLCKFCLRKLHPEQHQPDKPKTPRVKKGKLAVSYEEANIRLRDALKEILPIFESWGLERDIWNEYWYSVYHLDTDSGKISERFVKKYEIGSDQLQCGKRAFKAIMKEAVKARPRIKDRDQAERAVNSLADALRVAGYELNEKGNWIQVAK